MKRIELGLIIIALIAVIFKLFHLPFGGVLLVVSLSTLSIIYCWAGVLVLNDIGLRKLAAGNPFKGAPAARIVWAIILGVVLSVAPIGLLFKIQLWPSSEFLLLTSFIGLSILSMIAVYGGMAKKDWFTRSSMIRMLVWWVLSVSAYTISDNTWIDIVHRNYPDYAKALKEYHAHPEDPEAKENFERERDKLIFGEPTEDKEEAN